jgi:HK97 family phage portal protein
VRTEEEGHPLARLIRQGPNDRQTWPDFIECLVASVLLRGNALVEVRRDRAGQVQSLVFIPWDWVSVQLLANNRLAFDVFEPIGVGATGRQRRLIQEEVIHLKDRSDDGYVGRSRLSRAAEVIATATAADQFAGGFFRNSANPSGAIQIETMLGKDARSVLRAELDNAYVGPRKAGRVMILEKGMKWQQISISPEDAELLESRRFSVEELCRLYQCPPPIVQDYTHNTFTNSETAGRWFAQFTIGPWARKIEAEFARSVFELDGGHELELDMSGFLRGDPLTRWQSYAIALANEVLSPNEVRQVEGWNPRPGGDFKPQAPEPQAEPPSIA